MSVRRVVVRASPSRLLAAALALVFAGLAWPPSAGAGSAEALNRAACMAGRASCVRARLSLQDRSDVRASAAARNLADCRKGLVSCDRERADDPAAIERAVAWHAENVANCRGELPACNPLDLAPHEVRDNEKAALARRLEVNYRACRDRLGFCDRSLLTPAQRDAIPSQAR